MQGDLASCNHRMVQIIRTLRHVATLLKKIRTFASIHLVDMSSSQINSLVYDLANRVISFVGLGIRSQ